jgi:hypothetical protein
VSSRQLITPDLVQEIRHVIGRNSLARGSLRLEVTESLVMENPEQATHMLELLKDAGAGLALDDFGSGYSSLSYLQRFPFDTIKIDRSLVQASAGEGPGSAIVRSVVALGHELGRKVVAEGVETAEDAAFLRSIGCELAQGFYYGEPMPDRDVLHLLRLVRKADRRMRRRGWVRGQSKKKTGDGEAAPRPKAPPIAADRRPAPAPPLQAYRPGANGHDKSQPPAMRTGPPSQQAQRTRTPTQPVTQPPAPPAALQKRMRSAAANARARLAGLAGQAAFRPPEPPQPSPEASPRSQPPTPLRHTEESLELPRIAKTAVGSASGRPPPLPHQMLPSDKPRSAASPQAQAQAQARATARVRTQPPKLDVLHPQIKASLEKLAGGPVNLEPPAPLPDGPPDAENSEHNSVLGPRKRKA